MELTRQALIDKIQSKVTSIEDFNFDKLVAPPLYSLLSQYDIDRLYYIATSVKYSSKPKIKYQEMDKIMNARGFVKLSAGTNRVVYRFLESTDFVVKVAADAIGMGDNPREFENQFIFKPFVTKVFEVSPCGTVGVFERVQPITSREEFLSAADDIFEVINDWFIGKYIMADIGTKFFMNWGIRTYSTGKEGSVAFGPVLLDFPYVYELDGNKLFCSAVDQNSETGTCGGVIDYDSGFNFLHCTKCGVRYRVRELAKKIENKEIKIISSNGKEIKKMKIGRYDKDGNIVTTNGEIKAPVSKVTRTNESGNKSGKIGIDLSKLKAFAESKPEVVEHTIDNNKLRSNPGNNRGLVKAPASSGIKIDMKAAEEKSTVEENKEFNKLLEYNAEDDIIVLSNGDKEITATLSKIIPDDYKQCLIEGSAEYTQYLENINKINDLEAQLSQVQENADKNFEEFADEKEKFNQIIEEKDAKIAELTAALNEPEPEPEVVDPAVDSDVEKLKDEIAEKDNLIQVLNERLSVALANKTELKINGIPRSINPEYVEITSEEYGDAATLDGKVDKLKYFANTNNGDIDVIIFPTDEENGEYMTDENGNIICVATINGYKIGDLLAAVDDSEVVVTEEDKEEAVEAEEKKEEESKEE